MRSHSTHIEYLLSSSSQFRRDVRFMHVVDSVSDWRFVRHLLSHVPRRTPLPHEATRIVAPLDGRTGARM